MKNKSFHTRRKFIESALFAGAAVALPGLARGDQQVANGEASVTPLATGQIFQPEGSNCFWVGFSPLNDRVAFVSGTYDNMALYISRMGEPENFDVLWQPNTNLNCIKACAWSPNGREIAFLVQAVNDSSIPKTAKISIYIVNVVSKVVREPVIIGESENGKDRQLVNVSYKKGLSWWGDFFVCVPSNDGGVLKFDVHTGQSSVLITSQSGVFISSIVLTQSGELRFVKAKKSEAGGSYEFAVGGLKQDGTVCDYGNLNQQLGRIFSARLSQDGNVVFAEKGDMRSPDSYDSIIYNVETRSVVGQIPRVVQQQKDIYTYIPLAIRNGNEMILIEGAALAVDGGKSARNTIMKAAKINLL